MSGSCLARVPCLDEAALIMPGPCLDHAWIISGSCSVLERCRSVAEVGVGGLYDRWRSVAGALQERCKSIADAGVGAMQRA
jgi:hypothetical protein